jgi:Outer membrane protein beta-barrel domain
MIRKTSIVLISMLISGAANAQWEVGARGGISIPNLTSGSTTTPLNSNYKSRLGPGYGGYGEYHFTSLFSLEARIDYSAQGGKKNGFQALATPPEIGLYFLSQKQSMPPYLYADYKSEARINYLMIPVLAKFGRNLGPASHFRLYVAAGPFVAFLLSAKQITSGSSNLYLDEAQTMPLQFGEQSFDKTTDIKDQLHSTNFGVEGNAGLAYMFGDKMRHSIFIEAGGNYGFIEIQKGEANGKNRTGAGMVTAGYSYKFGKITWNKPNQKE